MKIVPRSMGGMAHSFRCAAAQLEKDTRSPGRPERERTAGFCRDISRILQNLAEYRKSGYDTDMWWRVGVALDPILERLPKEEQ